MEQIQSYPYCKVFYDSPNNPLIYENMDEFLFRIEQLISIQQLTQLYLYYKKNEIIVFPDHVEVDTNEYTLATGERIPIQYTKFQLKQWIRKITRTLPIF